MNRSIHLVWALGLLAAGCSMNRDTAKNDDFQEPVIVELPEIEVTPEVKIYNPSEAKVHDLIHTRLDVAFDWKQQRLNGTATIKLKPWFYSSDRLILDAKGMDIKGVKVQKKEGSLPLEFSYDSLYLDIALDKLYARGESYTVIIDYTAKPNELKMGGSAAIAGDKGLYFINPDSTEVGKPTQIWTQGETEASSCWYPTIDSPNQRMTQEIFITVRDGFKTLSNGELVYSNFNADGTRTDYWNMELPHAPYLTMMAIGDFAIAKDKWKDPVSGKEIPVDYYVEQEFGPYAFDIFGKTPQMMTVYSDLLDYPYPWNKYSQVVVRDYVSGAMENTTATVHGEFLQRTRRELLDDDNEAIIAHELFHQWFGDVVTCESWANLPLNESFATYGEYLWYEFGHSKDAAEHHGYQSMQGYFSESRTKKVDLIRFDYDDKEDMFDGHSYNKGGRVLHMLRNVVGDEAFFAGLNLYLKQNEYKDVEIHHLRLAMEEVTGMDLNWFFNQWFLDKGHPELLFSYSWNDSLNIQEVMIRQTQDTEEYPVYRLPIGIDIWVNDERTRHEVVLTETEQVFSFATAEKPQLVNVDADKVLLAKKKDMRDDASFVYQFYHAQNYLDRIEVLDRAVRSEDPMFDKVLVDALKDPFYAIREKALNNLGPIVDRNPEIELHLNRIITSDPKSVVKAAAIDVLSDNYSDASYKALYETLTEDQSYAVASAALGALYQADPAAGVKKAKSMEAEDNMDIIMSIAEVYTADASPAHNEYFVEKIKQSGGFDTFGLAQAYSGYLMNQEPEVVDLGLPIFEDIARNADIWWMKFAGYQALYGLLGRFDKEAGQFKAMIEAEEGSETRDEEKLANLRQSLAVSDAERAKIDALINSIKADESDARILGAFGG